VRRLLLLVSAVVLVDMTFYAAIAPLLPQYQDDLGLSKSAAGGLTAAYAAGTLIASIPAGRLAGRVGGKPTMLVGLGLLAASSLAFGFGKDLVVLDGARFVQGVGGACTWAGGFAWLMSAAPRERRGELIGSALGAAVVGVLLGPVLGGAATETSPELVFSAVSVIALLLAGVALATPAGAPGPAASWGELAGAFRRRPVLLAAWLVTLPALFTGTIDVLVPLRLDDLGASGLTIGAVFLAAAAIEAALSPVLGRFTDRRGRLLPLRVGLAVAALSALALPLPETVWLAATGLLIAATALALFWTPAAAMLSESSESAGLDQGLAFGLMNLAWALGQVVGGAAGGTLADAAGDGLSYAILGGLCAGTLLLTGRTREGNKGVVLNPGQDRREQAGQGSVPRAR